MATRNCRPQWVYFIAALEAGVVKIGCAGSVYERLGHLQSGNHEALTVLLAIEHRIPRDLERKLHARFAEDRIRGEWFTLTERIEVFIAEFTSGKVDTFAEHRCTGRYIAHDRFARVDIPGRLVTSPPLCRDEWAKAGAER